MVQFDSLALSWSITAIVQLGATQAIVAEDVDNVLSGFCQEDVTALDGDGCHAQRQLILPKGITVLLFHHLRGSGQGILQTSGCGQSVAVKCTGYRFDESLAEFPVSVR